MKNFDAHIPIYLQIIRSIQQLIVSGTWRPGERVPTVRDLALEFGVNPNTVQRALFELERDGLIHTERTSGRFVTTDTELIANIRKALCKSVIETATEELKNLGYTLEEIKQLLKNHHAQDETK